MPNEPKHTPTPWHIRSYTNYKGFSIWEERGSKCVCERWDNLEGQQEINKANAEFIVRAVNSHQALLDACRQIANGPFSHDCPHCHKTDRYQVASEGIKFEHHKEDCPVRIAMTAIRLAEGKEVSADE